MRLVPSYATVSNIIFGIAAAFVVFIMLCLSGDIMIKVTSPHTLIKASEWRCVMFKSVPPVPAPEVDNCLMYLRKE